MAFPPEAQQLQLRKILADLLKLPENKECADCGTKAPIWASTNLGVFVCIRCSGIHRSLGVHISKVRSTSLDKWTHELVESMQQMGNARAKEIYEATVSNGYQMGDIRNDNFALERWIRDKYERKLFMRRDYDPRSAPSSRPQQSQQQYSQQRENNVPAPPAGRSRAPSSGSSTGRPRGASGGSASIPTPVAAPKPVAAKAAPKAAPSAPANDLLNWDEPTSAPVPNGASPPSNDFNEFGDFVTATPEKPSVDKSSIMSLFQPAMVATPVMMHPGYPYGGPQQPQGYPAPNYNVHGLGVPGSMATHPPAMPVMPGMPGMGGMPGMMGMPPQGMPHQGMPGMGMPGMGGMPGMPPMAAYPGYGAAPGYPVPGGVPGYYGMPAQMGARPAGF